MASGGGAGRERRTCDAEKLDGSLCRSFALPGSLYCLAHDPERAEQLRESRAEGARKSNKLRVLRGRRMKLSSMPELVKFAGDLIYDTVQGDLDYPIARTALYGISIQRQLLEAGDLAARIAAIEARLDRVTRPAKAV